MSDNDVRIPCSGPVGFNRRSFVQCGVLGAFGFTLADFFRAKAYAGEVRSAAGGLKLAEGPAKSVIQIYLPGGTRPPRSPGILSLKRLSSIAVPWVW